MRRLLANGALAVNLRSPCRRRSIGKTALPGALAQTCAEQLETLRKLHGEGAHNPTRGQSRKVGVVIWHGARRCWSI